MSGIKIESSIKNKKAIDVSRKMGRRYSLLDAMMMGRRLGIDWKKEKFTVGDLLVGMHYELEHGKVDPETNVTNDSPKKTAKIAWAHLKERPDYYVQLMKMDPPHKIEKKAAEKDDDEDTSNEKAMIGAGAIGAGSLAIAKSKNALLGKKRVYHGTTSDNYKSIMKSGIDPKYGGDKGRGSYNFYLNKFKREGSPYSEEKAEYFRKRSEGRAYVTAKRPIAYLQSKGIIKAGAKGKNKVVVADIPLNKWQNSFEMDPDSLPFVTDDTVKHLKDNMKNGSRAERSGAKRKYNNYKNIASYTNDTIPTEAIKGSKAKLKDRAKYTKDNLAASIKANPVRFGLGVASTAAGAYGVYKGAKMIAGNIKRKREKKKQEEKEKAEKTAHEFLDEMVKTAAYLKDIDCEQCGFKGKPDPDGTCPECGAIGGHKAYGVQKKHEPTLEDIENSKNTADDDYREEQENIHSMIIGG